MYRLLLGKTTDLVPDGTVQGFPSLRIIDTTTSSQRKRISWSFSLSAYASLDHEFRGFSLFVLFKNNHLQSLCSLIGSPLARELSDYHCLLHLFDLTEAFLYAFLTYITFSNLKTLTASSPYQYNFLYECTSINDVCVVVIPSVTFSESC